MTLRVESVPAPPAGADWSYEVPGKYLENIVSVQARLDTSGAPTNALTDLSGNHNDGTYIDNFGFGAFVPGLLAGRGAWRPGAAPGAPSYDGATINRELVDWLNPFTIAYWMQFGPAEAGGQADFIFAEHVPFQSVYQHRTHAGIPPFDSQPVTMNTFPDGWVSDDDVLVADGAPHHIALVWDGATLVLYIDGVVAGWVTVGNPATSMVTADRTNLGAPSIGAGTFQALGFFATDLAAGTVGALYAAGAGGAAIYEAAALALAPAAYYRLDGAGGGGGRTPVLRVSAAADIVAELGTGIDASEEATLTDVTWLVGAQSDIVTSGGAIVTAGAPELILPGGYILSTFTPDIAPTDQWSNITIWWNDDIMQIVQPTDPFVYRPGAYLIITPKGAAP